jgi:hypothetical protein
MESCQRLRVKALDLFSRRGDPGSGVIAVDHLREHLKSQEAGLRTLEAKLGDPPSFELADLIRWKSQVQDYVSE